MYSVDVRFPITSQATDIRISHRNADVSGLGVRISIYVQNLLTIILIRFSPENAKSAWWSMSTTAIGLATASIATGARQSITLFDAIVSSYLLVLPLITTSYAAARIIETKRFTSPLLIVIDAVRHLFTSIFGVWLWSSAPHFGSQFQHCNDHTLFLLGTIRATSTTARSLGLIFWTSYLALFLVRQLLHIDTLLLSMRAIFSTLAAHAFRLPRRTGPADMIHRSTTRIDLTVIFGLQIPFIFESAIRTWSWSVKTEDTRRPTREFHSIDSFIPTYLFAAQAQLRNAIRWVLTAVVLFLSFAVMTMTELELYVINKGITKDTSFGYGQILPVALTFVPLLSLIDWWIQSKQTEDAFQPLPVLLIINNIHGLPPRNDGSPMDTFLIISINESEQIFTTWIQRGDSPTWNESFVISISPLSTIFIQIFDAHTRGTPELFGHTIIHPMHNLPASFPIDCSTEVIHKDGTSLPNTLSYTLSTDIDTPPFTPDPSTLIPRNDASRHTQFFTLYSLPVISLFSITYRIEMASQNFKLTGEPPPSQPTTTAQRPRGAHTVWFAGSAIFPSMSFGYIAESSPTRLAEPTRHNSPLYEIDALRHAHALEQSDDAFQPLLVMLPEILRRWLKIFFPLTCLVWLSDEFVMSFGLPFFSFGISKTRPLPL